MKTLLVATDFSTAGNNAAHYAAKMAMAINASLILLHVYEIPVTFSEVPVVLNEEQIISDAEEELKNIKNELMAITAGDVAIDAHVKIGTFFSKLEATCHHLSPYAVIMGSQGTTAAERLLFGGHTVYAMKHLKWPLISVPVGASFNSVKKVGLACNLDKMVDSLPAEEILTLVEDFHAELHILNIGKQSEFHPEMIFSSERLEKMLKPITPNFHFIAGKDTDEAIIHFAYESQLDLLIVIPKRQNLIEKLLHHSHTKKLVLHSHIPAMALKEVHVSVS